MQKIKRALLSVSDKTGLVDLAKKLTDFDVEIISTGGTLKTLLAAGIKAISVSDVTGFPEIMDGRVKTLHPFIHGGILARRDKKEHLAVAEEKGIGLIDMVVVNLYPFEATVSRPDTTLELAIENIDIGGPSMVRSAAKNYQSVAIVTNPKRYAAIMQELEENQGALSQATRFALAKEAFSHTAQYDTAISHYLEGLEQEKKFSESITLSYEKAADLRYGENPHQKAAFYREKNVPKNCVAGAEKKQGKELSFNNLVDLEAALDVVREFTEPAVAIIKHTNPCGAACGEDLLTAYKKAYEADSLSAYGGIVACNKKVEADTAEEMVKTFLEAVIAPGFSEAALRILAAKPNLRVLELDEIASADDKMEYKFIGGGLLVQTKDKVALQEVRTVTKQDVTPEEMEDLLFAWKIVKNVKSNAIVLAKNKQTVGVGAGQMSRVESVKIALGKAGEKAEGSLLASDAFFPFADGVEAAIKGGVKAFIQPGGANRDEDVVAMADNYKKAMLFTGTRHFKH